MALSRSIWLVIPVVAAVVACAPKPPPPPPPPPPPDFSGQLAFSHLEALAAIGPRVAGSEGADAARSYLREQLEGHGLEVFEQADEFELSEDEPPVAVRNLVAVVPGESTDLVVLAAPFGSQHFEEFRFVGANDGASGAALLLEFARVLVERPLPYTTWLAFLDAEAPAQPDLGDEQGLLGSRLLVNELEAADRLETVRLLVYFNQVADRELGIARDLRSNRRFRNAFFEAARRQGHADAFPEDAPLESPAGGHLAFLKARMRRVVLVTDDRFGGDDPPGIYSHTEEDDLPQCSAESLDAVGRVSEAALRDITATLVKIDRFARRPQAPTLEGPGPAADESEAAPPESPGAGETGGDEVQQGAQAAEDEAEAAPASLAPEPADGDGSEAIDAAPGF